MTSLRSTGPGPETPQSPAASVAGASHSAARPAAGRAWLREPLLHFVLIGAVLFGIDSLVFSRTDDPRRITIDAAVDKEGIRVFQEVRGRAPNQDELYGVRRVWLDNEVLYREGLALQMDKGDKAIRDRVIFKALSTINAGLSLPPVNDAVLRAWFETNRAKYDEPPRLDFSEAVLPEATPTEATARAMAGQLGSGTGGEANAGLRVFSGRPLANIVQSYGAEFSAALQAATPGEWRAMRHGDVWRVIRLEAISAPRPASFDTLRNQVLQDWTDAVMSEQRADAVKVMAMKYKVVTEAPAP